MRSYFRLMREKERWGWGWGQIDGLRRERGTPWAEAELSPQHCATTEADGSDLASSETGEGEAVAPVALGSWLAECGGQVNVPQSPCCAPLGSLQGEGGLMAQLLPQVPGRKSRLL